MPKSKPVEVEVVAETAEAPKVAKRTQWRNETTVTLTDKGAKNPKKPGSMSFDRYEVLLNACSGGSPATVAALFKGGYRMDDIRHDVAHGHIEINQPFEL